VGDYVYLETSQIKKTPILAPFRSGPYAITKIVAGGNAVFLEGFRHPFNVELITPTLRYANGITPHLTKHVLESNETAPIAPNTQGVEGTLHNADMGVTNSSPEDEVLDIGAVVTGEEGAGNMATQTMGEAAGVHPHLELQVDITGQTGPEEELSQEEAVGLAQGVEAAVQEFLDDSEEAWEFNPIVRIVPSSSSQQTSPSQGSIVRRVPEIGVIDSALGIAVAVPPVVPNSIVESSALDAPVVDIADYVILPDQLPGNICKVLSKSGNTMNSSVLLCLCDNGIKCNIGYRHLYSLLGKEETLRLLTTLVVP